MKLRLLGLCAAALVFAADQAGKAAMLGFFANAEAGAVTLNSWLELTLAWNPGVSYSLFSAHSQAGRLALLGFTALAVMALALWLWRAQSLVSAVALGALIGGALGNALDRARFGAVADFIHFHIGAFSPFGVFNIADMAIFAGVALLLYDTVFPAAQSGGSATKTP